MTSYEPPKRTERPLSVIEDIRGVEVHVGDTIAAAFRSANQGELRSGTVKGITLVENAGYYESTRVDVEVTWETSSLSWGRVVTSKISPERIMKIELPDPKNISDRS